MREKGELENKYHKLRSLLSDQDVKLFFAKQQSERLRQKVEKENQASRHEESKAIKAKLLELEEVLVRSEHEKAELDHQRVEQVEHTQQEYQAIIASLRQKITALDDDKAQLASERDEGLAKLSSVELHLQEMAAVSDEASRMHSEETGMLLGRIEELVAALTSAETAIVELGVAREEERSELSKRVAQLTTSEAELKQLFSQQKSDESSAAQARLAAEAAVQTAALRDELQSAITARSKAEDHSRTISMEVGTYVGACAGSVCRADLVLGDSQQHNYFLIVIYLFCLNTCWSVIAVSS